MNDLPDWLFTEAHRVLVLAADIFSEHAPVHLLVSAAALDAALVLTENRLRDFLQLRQNEQLTGSKGSHAATLLHEIAFVRNALLTGVLAQRNEMMFKADQALQRLRKARSTDELISQIPREVVGLGYLRALFSWVDQAHWVAQTAYSANGHDEARLLVEAGQQKPLQNMRNLFEFEMLEQRKAILRQGVKGSTRVHPELARLTQSESYVAAPLLSANSVVGFISLDVNVTSGTVDKFDRDLISLFSAGAGLALERVRTLERIASAESEVNQNIEIVKSLMEALRVGDAAPVTLSAPGPAIAAHRKDEPLDLRWASQLTRREEQVLRLISDGLANGEIAARLYVAESTVKTHVKSVLRKLGVSSRIEAASLYHQR